VTRNIRTFLPLVGEPTALALAFESDPQRWLPAARQEGAHRWRLEARAGSLSRPVLVTVGTPWRAGRTRWRSVAWTPVDPQDGEPTTLDRFLPTLEGELGVHLRRGGPATLMFDVRYEPPGGPFGSAADALALSRVARGTVERFLEEVAPRLTAEAILLAPAGPRRSAAGDLPDEHRTGAVGV